MRSDRLLGEATSFIWATEQALYLVTNWHVVTAINPWTGERSNDGAHPDRLIIDLDLVDGSRGPVSVPLYDAEGHPLWLRHPMKLGIDVIALPLPDVPGALAHPINAMATTPIAVNVGMDAFIIGFPFGIRTGQFPIWKRASIASEPEVAINGCPYFFADTASRGRHVRLTRCCSRIRPISARKWIFGFDEGAAQQVSWGVFEPDRCRT